MAENRDWIARAGAQTDTVAIDQGLRAYMLGVYNYMTVGLAITGLVAWAAATSGLYAAIAGTPLIWAVIFAPLALVMYVSFRIHKLSPLAAQTTFWVYAGLMGLSLSYVFLAYTGVSVARVFFITAASFAALSLYGYTTKRDLSGFGTFLFMGLVGLVIASLVNIFLQSPALHFAVSAIGVLVFAGLTAYDTQQIKEMYFEGDDRAVLARKSILGALRLYLDFINLFMFLLQFLGNRE